MYETAATVTFDDLTYENEPGAIDLSLEGNSLLGLPFFLAKCSAVTFGLATRQLSLVPLPG